MAGLPWIQVHTDLPRHPKSVRLGLALGDPRAWTYMVELWAWCAECLPSGRFEGKDSDRVLEHGAGWRGEPGKFVDACVDSGFLEQDADALCVHDWDVHAGAHMEKRAREVNRLRKYRNLKEKTDRTRTRTLRVQNVERTRSVPVEREREIERDKKQLLSRAPREPHGRHQETIDLFARLWAENRGGAKYRPPGADFPAVKRLLGYPEATPEEVERRMRCAFADDWFRGKGTLAFFVSRWSTFDGRAGRERGAASPVSVFADPTYDGPIDFATGLPPRKLVIEETG